MSEDIHLIMIDTESGAVAQGQVRFDPGIVVATPGALDLAAQTDTDLVAYLVRHLCGDWGDLDHHDRAQNVRALRTGARLLSVYNVTATTRLWIITDASDRGMRAATTLLLPEEY